MHEQFSPGARLFAGVTVCGTLPALPPWAMNIHPFRDLFPPSVENMQSLGVATSIVI